MKKNILSLLLFFSVFICFDSNGQAIRITYFEYNTYDRSANSAGRWGFGYEHNLGDKISLSLEYLNSYGFGEGNENGVGLTTYKSGTDELSFYYQKEVSHTEFSYTAKYFFVANDDGSAYISSGIGYRKVKFITSIQDLYLNGNSVTNYGGLSATSYDDSFTTFPITFKLGYRGSLDGWFGDYYIGGSFAKDQGWENQTIELSNIPRTFRSFSFVFGLSFGFGWVD